MSSKNWLSLIVISMAATFAGVARADICDPSFDEATPDCSPNPGWQWEGMAGKYIVDVGGGAQPNGFALLREEDQSLNIGDPGRYGNGLSRVYQDITLPASPEALSFKYRLVRPNGVARNDAPPDSFSAWLTTPTGTRLIPASGGAPTFTGAFFYEDTDGAMVFDSSVVVVTAPDSAGFRTVIANISGLSNVSARLEFGFAHAKNDISSFVAVDDVVLNCPPGFCCGATTIEHCLRAYPNNSPAC